MREKASNTVSMIELDVHDIFWCDRHGHPVLALRARAADRYFAVSVAAADASALAANPPPSPEQSTARLHGLLQSIILGLGAEVLDVQLFVGADSMLRAAIRLDGPRGEITVPAYFADGIALARRRRLPLRMDEADADRIPSSRLHESAPATTAATEAPAPLAPYRAFIDSLDLEWEDEGAAGAG